MRRLPLATIKRMTKSIKYHLVVILTLTLLLANSGYGQDNSDQKLEYDHILLFASDYALKDSLDRIFTPAEKLTTEHKSQGTIGYYYLFYNTYIELLFLQDTLNAKLNKVNFGSDYLSRWIQDESYCPVGFGMIVNPWDTIIENTDFHKYVSNDSRNDEYYLMSKYNSNLSQPLLYVSMPHRAYKPVKSLDEIDERPKEIRSDLKEYLTHESQVKRITKIIYSYSSENKDKGNMKILQKNSSIHIERSDSISLTLVFDNERTKQKKLRLNDHTKLIIKY